MERLRLALLQSRVLLCGNHYSQENTTCWPAQARLEDSIISCYPRITPSMEGDSLQKISGHSLPPLSPEVSALSQP